MDCSREIVECNTLYCRLSDLTNSFSPEGNERRRSGRAYEALSNGRQLSFSEGTLSSNSSVFGGGVSNLEVYIRQD